MTLVLNKSLLGKIDQLENELSTPAWMDAVRTACLRTVAVSLVISGSQGVICSLSSSFNGVLTESRLLKQRSLPRH